MAKLYFKYGTMGSSKTAQALITKFNYEERHMKVLLLKPAIDNRDGENICRSRIGLQAEAIVIHKDTSIKEVFQENNCKEKIDVVIVDECQFLAEEQVDQLSDIVIENNIPVICFGLRADFLTHLFPASKRLFEIADSISEIKYICGCGHKAIVNARLDKNGDVITKGEQVLLGGNETYKAMCLKCWKDKIKEQENCKKN